MEIENNINLICGDCLEEMKNIPDESIDFILTDPPYSMTRNKWDSLIPFPQMWEQLNRIIKPNGAIALFGQEPFTSNLIMSNVKNFKYNWYWEKEAPTGFLNANRQPMRIIETVSIFYKHQCVYHPQMKTGFKPYSSERKGCRVSENYNKDSKPIIKSHSDGERFPTNLVMFPRDKKKAALHPTQKPVSLLEYLIKTYTDENDIVLDFTFGSGSTAVACINTNRRFIGIEKDSKYFEIAKNRISNTQVNN